MVWLSTMLQVILGFLICSQIKSTLTCYSDRTTNNCCPSVLDDVVFSNNVSNIASYALNGCDKLRSVYMPDSVISVGDGAFAYCSNLMNVTLSKNLIDIGAEVFRGAYQMSSLTIPSAVRSIGAFFISSCLALEYMSFPNDGSRIMFDTYALFGSSFDGVQFNLKYCPYFSNDTSITYTANTYETSPVCPTLQPSLSPTWMPTDTPTIVPTITPTHIPTYIPTRQPTYQPSELPTTLPTYQPSYIPTIQPSELPTTQPTQPTLQPTVQSNKLDKQSSSSISTDIRVVIGLCVGLPIIGVSMLLLLGYYIYTMYQAKEVVTAADSASAVYIARDSTVTDPSSQSPPVSHADYINRDEMTAI